MPLSPSQILSASQSIFGGPGTTSLSSVRARYAQEKRDSLAKILEQEEQEKDSPSLLERAGGILGGAIRPLARGLDAARAGVVAGSLEAGDFLSDLVGRTEGDASLEDLRTNFNRRIGVGDVLEETELTRNLPLNVKRVLGGAGDLALDPLNYVTLGTSAAAKAGLSRVAASQGDDVARILAREGADAADSAIASRLAAEQAQEAAARGAFPRTPQDALAARVAAPAPPTVRDILGAGVSSRGLERTLRGVDRTGAGGIGFNFGRLGAPTLRSGDDIANSMLVRGTAGYGRAAGDLARWADGTKIGARVTRPAASVLEGLGTARQAAREALIPLTETRDAFGQHIAEAIPGIVARRTQFARAAMEDFDRVVKPILKNVNENELDAIRAALDVGGPNTSQAFDLLDGAPEAQNLLTELVRVRDRTYDTLIQSGVDPESLLPKEEYLRHRLTPEGLAELGIKQGRGGKGVRTGAMQKRTREGSIDAQNAAEDAISYETDPARLVRSSLAVALEVGGNRMMADALEDVAKGIRGFDVKAVVRHEAAPGFTKVAPDRWVADEIYSDAFNLAKSGTQSEIVRAWDTFSAMVKRQTLFNPVAFGPYFTQNMATGIAINAVDGVRASDYATLRAWHRASARALKEAGEEGYDEALARYVPDAAERAIIKDLRTEGIFGAGHPFYDDFSEQTLEAVGQRSAKRRLAELGTNHTVKVNQFGEEMLRGAAYRRHRLNGLPSGQAADLVRKRHLDYSAVGRTRLERDKITRFIFFPTWLMRAPAAIVRAYAHTPGLANVQAKLEMGKNWSDRERNEYGEIIGPRLSGPLSFLSGLGNEATGEPIEQVNPLIRAVFDDSARDVSDILPPTSVVRGRDGSFDSSRLGGILSDEEKRERFLRSLGGVRTGVDYGAERGRQSFEKSLAEREAKRQENPDLPETTPKIRLVEEAVAAGVEEPYSMNSGELARALLEKGYTADEITDVLEDNDRPLQIHGIRGPDREDSMAFGWWNRGYGRRGTQDAIRMLEAMELNPAFESPALLTGKIAAGTGPSPRRRLGSTEVGRGVGR